MRNIKFDPLPNSLLLPFITNSENSAISSFVVDGVNVSGKIFLDPFRCSISNYVHPTNQKIYENIIFRMCFGIMCKLISVDF